jgi:hypothetical protein
MFPMERFFDGMDQENSKTQGGKGGIKRIQKNKKERKNGGKKTKRFFTYVEVPILMCFPSVGNALGLPASCDPPLGEPTHMGTSPTTKFPINTGVKVGVRGTEIAVWYSPPKLVQLSWAPVLCS